MSKKQSIASLEAILLSRYDKQHGLKVKRDKPYGVIYTRVSSKEQEENNSSLSIQLKVCNEAAQRNKIIVKEYFGGKYESAKTDGRKEFQRMLKYVKSDSDIQYIIVFNYDRFSRTGAAAMQLGEGLAKIGVHLKSVTQEIDSSTASGKFQENLYHMFSHYDNMQRAMRTRTSMKSLLEDGYWTFSPPFGYENLNRHEKVTQHKYVITAKGELLKKAFKWKAEGVLTNKEIIDRLKKRGLSISEKNFQRTISNPFYAGYITGKILGGKLFNGRHPALVDLETFLKANDLSNSSQAGIAKNYRVEELPLKVFAKDDDTGCLMTGYKTKGTWYYKARERGIKVNVRAQTLNSQFVEMLGQFEYNKSYATTLQQLLKEKLSSGVQQQVDDTKIIRKRITELEGQLETIEEKYVLENLDQALYIKFSDKIRKELGQLREELAATSFDSSNLDSIIKKGMSLAENLSQLWVSADFSNKQKLQRLVFPEGIRYNKKNSTVRTEKVNSLFAAIPLLKPVVEDKEKGDLKKDRQNPRWVTPQGLEPWTY